MLFDNGALPMNQYTMSPGDDDDIPVVRAQEYSDLGVFFTLKFLLT